MKNIIAILIGFNLILTYETSVAGSTNKPALNPSHPTWSEIIQCDAHNCPRFESVMGGLAVLDHETDLVWEKTPLSTPQSWSGAVYYCAQLEVGARAGWHLPTIEQLASLADLSVSGAPKLPTGHPFVVVQNPAAWSSTTWGGDSSNDAAWGLEFFDGRPLPVAKSLGVLSAWCVRGGQSNDWH